MLKKLIQAMVKTEMDEALKRIKALEDVVFTLKENVKEQKKEQSFAKARKWLNSYPDESDRK